MQPKPYLWNTHDLTPYGAEFAEESALFGMAQYSELMRSGTWPVRGGKTFTGTLYTLTLIPTAGQEIGTFRDLMGLWFNEETDEEPVFTIKDMTTGASSKQWYVNAEFLGFLNPGTSDMKAVLHASDPIWKSVTVQTNTRNLTASGQTKSVVVGGNRIARPQYNLKTTSARAGGYAYKRYIAIANRTDKVYSDAIIVTDGNFAHLTLVGAGKALASGNDLRVTRDGAQIFRWAGGGGFNTNTLRPTCNLSLPPQINLTLSGTLSAVGAISTITVQSTAENKIALQRLALQKNKVIAIELDAATEEIFTYTGTDPNAYTITGTTRAMRLSTNQAQIDGASIRHIPYDIYLLYGDSAATAPTTDDNFKPIFDIANTTTTSRAYLDYQDAAKPSRAGQWVMSATLNTGGLCRFTRANHATQATPASEMGMIISAYYVGSTPRGGAGKLRWSLTHPAGITSVTPTGEKYRKNVSTGWPVVAALQRFDGVSWVTVVNEATPTTNNTWEALTTVTGAQALGATYPTVGFAFEGSVNGIADTYAAIEFDGITVALDSSKVPLISMSAETVNEWQDFRITNTTTGQWLEFTVPGDVNNNIYIDTEALDAYVVETGERFPVRLNDESRADWLPIDPAPGSGSNTIAVTQAGLVACTLTVTHEERNN